MNNLEIVGFVLSLLALLFSIATGIFIFSSYSAKHSVNRGLQGTCVYDIKDKLERV